MDHVEALAPLGEQVRDQLWRVLLAGVDDHGRGAAGMIEAGGQRQFLAEVARQAQQLDRRVANGDWDTLSR